jgi:HEPN domain-containing protein
MNEVQEWIAFADRDLETAQREARVRVHPNFNAACFYAHQCAEKYLKGFMLSQALPFEKIHDLLRLSAQIQQDFPEFVFINEWLGLLNQYPVAARYPGLEATRQEAKDAVNAAKHVRDFVRPRIEI